MLSVLGCCGVIPGRDSREDLEWDDRSEISYQWMEETTSFEETLSPVIIESPGFLSRENQEARYYFGYPTTFTIAIRDLDKLYWWKKFYIFSSEKIDTSTRSKRLRILEHHYNNLRTELLVGIGNMAPPPPIPRTIAIDIEA